MASVSHNEMSIVILSTLQQPSPALWLRFSPTETLMEQHSSPSWSSWPHIAVAHLSDPLTVFTQADVLTSPAPTPASSAKAQCNIFSLPWTGAWLQCQEVRQVNSRFLFGISICERNCNYPPGRGRSGKQRVQLGMQMKGREDDGMVSADLYQHHYWNLIRTTFKLDFLGEICLIAFLRRVRFFFFVD